MIKRSASIALLLLAGVLSAFAQDSSGQRAVWGIKAAADLNIPGKWRGKAGSVDMYRNGFGGTIGAVCNIDLAKRFYLEPGISLFYDTYSYKDFIISDEPGYVTESDPSLYKLGLRVPIVAGYDVPLSNDCSFTVYTGPEVSYAFAGEINFKDKRLKEEYALFGKSGFQRRIDCAWKVGVGFAFNSWMISLDGAIGMTDLLKESVTFHENRLTLGLTRYL